MLATNHRRLRFEHTIYRKLQPRCGASDFAVRWDYQTDLNNWLTPTTPIIPGCTSAQPTCLNGLWWNSARTDIGTPSNNLVGLHATDLSVGADNYPLNIADALTPIAPNSGALLWCPIPSPIIVADPPVFGSTGPIGWGPGKLVWLAPSSSSSVLDTGLVSGDARFLVADTTSGVAGTLQSDGSAIAAESIGSSNGGGDEVDSTLHSGLFSTLSTWVSAVEPSRAIPGSPYDAVALSFDGTQSLATARTINGVLTGAPIIKPVGDPPAPRSQYATAYSRAAGGVFVAGGTAVSDNSTLHDVWFQPVGGAWSDVTPQGAAAPLGTIDAITYSYDDQKIWIIDEVPFVAKKSHFTVVRLIRASPGGSIEQLASWIKLGLADRQYLSVDHDGAILATFAHKKHGFVTARVVDAASNKARVKALYIDWLDTLHGARFVSPVGYGFFVQNGTTDEVLRLRALPALSFDRSLDETLCQ